MLKLLLTVMINVHVGKVLCDVHPFIYIRMHKRTCTKRGFRARASSGLKRNVHVVHQIQSY